MSTGKNGNGDLESVYEHNTRWAEWLARLIIVGLAVEIIAVFVLHKPPLEGTLTILANVLIVAGVWGELIFEARAKKAGDGIVAEAKARAAEANARAVEAQLALEKLKTPRSLTAEQQDAIAEAMRPFAGQKFEGEIASGVPDAYWLWVALAKALIEAGWIPVAAPGLTIGDPPASISLYPPTGIGIGIPTLSRVLFEEMAVKLVMALGKAKIRAGIAYDENSVIPPDTIVIQIGTKPQ